jgi:hypothetical protein
MAGLAEIFTSNDVDFVQHEGDIIFNVSGECSPHQITFTDAPFGWIRAKVWVEPYGAKRVRRFHDLTKEMGERFGHRVIIAFLNGGFTVFTFIRPDRAPAEIRDFVYACDRIIPLLMNLKVTDGVAVWDEQIMAAAFVDVEARIQ